VLIQDKRLQPLAQIPSANLPNWADIVGAFQLSTYLPAEFSDRKLAHTVREPIVQTFETCARLVVPIITRKVARGYVSLIARRAKFSSVDRIVAAQGALVAAIEMAKIKAVNVAEKKLRGDLIEAVLTQDISEADALRWAERAGFRRTGPYAALTLQWAGHDSPSLRRLETIVSGQIKRHRARTLASARENEIVVLYALAGDGDVSEAVHWAEQTQALAHAEFPRARLAAGVGRVVGGILDLRTSYHEAAQAMALEQRLRHGKPKYYGDLGVYRLLLPLAESGELRLFAEQVLGPLLTDERAARTHLLETLTAFFTSNGNVVKTAQALYIHRNTLIYRLNLIRELGAIDLDDPEARLRVHLALRANELARAAR
jgi:purine catabolism regulator